MLRERTGLVADPYFSATKLEWLLRDAELSRRAAEGELAAGTVESWLVAKLTGGRAHVTDHTNASRTLLYDLRSRDWAPELLERFGVPAEVLPAIVRSSGVVGADRRHHLGWSLPIAGLAGDQQAALFGQGCVSPGLAKNTYGTGAFLLVLRRRSGSLAVAGSARHGGVWRRWVSRPTRWKAASSWPAPRCSGSGTASGSSSKPPRPRRWPGASLIPAGSTSSQLLWGWVHRTGNRRPGERSPV